MASIDETLPRIIRLHRLGIAFSLPADVSINAAWDRELRTTGRCLVRLGFTREALEIAASPPLLLDAVWPAKNMALSGLTCRFADGAITVHLEDRERGLMDFRSKAREELTALAKTTLKGTRAAQPGYDPFADQDLVQTLTQLGSNFEASPTRGRSEAGAQHLQEVAADAELEVVEGFTRDGLRIAPGGRIAVGISGAGGLAQVLAAKTPGAALQAAALRHIALSSDALLLEAGGRPIGRLEQLRLLRGGAVHIDRLTLEGAADLAAGVEALVEVLYRAARFSDGGLGPDAAMLLAAHPNLRSGGLIESTARQLIGALLSEAVNTLLGREAVVAGIELRAVLGLA